MHKRQIGRTGVHVFPIGLGGMPLSIQSRPERTQAFEVIKKAVECGVTFIDTANVYCIDDHDIGHNEVLIMECLRKLGKENEVTVATKGGLRRPNGDWTVDGSPSFLRQSCEKSLKSMGVDSIFLYQLHASDDKVPLEDSIGELKKLKEEGKIQHIGVSNFSPEQVKKALSVTRIETVQNRCHPLNQPDYHNGMLTLCENEELSFLPHSPVGGHHGHFQAKDHGTLLSIADSHDHSPYQIMLAWALAQSECVIPIPGASRPQSIESSTKAVSIVLENEEIQRIDRL